MAVALIVGLAELVSLALFIGMVGVWAAVLS